MLEVELSIRHHGCPVSDTSKHYPHLQIQNISKVEGDSEVSKRLLGLRGNQNDITEFADDFRAHDQVQTFDRVSNSNDLTYFSAHIEYHEGPSIASIVQSIGCFQHSTVTVQGGIENWVVYTDDRTLVHDLVSKVESYENEVTLYRSVDVGEISGQKMSGLASLSNQLTPAQQKAFERALQEDYYILGEDVTVKDVAETLDRHYTTVWEHLDKAEKKILQDVGAKLFDTTAGNIE